MSALGQTLGGVDVSRETIKKLTVFRDLITKWTKKINLIAPNTVPDIWNRHIIDSVQIYGHADPNWKHWIDLGSGGGLPGLVIAILEGNTRPVTLIESDTRKCLFLNTVRRELDLNVTVVNDRIENVQIERGTVLTARALAPLSELLGFTECLLEPSGTALFSKGERYQEELDVALKTWQFDCTTHPSHTNPAARVLEISRIARRES